MSQYPTDSDVHSSSDDEQPIRPVKLHRSNILTSDSETEETSETLSQSVQSRIVVSSTRNLRGKNGHKWSSTPAESSRTQTQARNLVHVVQGPMGAAKDVTEPLECFSIFITNDIVRKNVTHTNEEISLKSSEYKNQTATVSHTCEEEIRSLLGLLLLSAMKKDNHLTSLSRERFVFL